MSGTCDESTAQLEGQLDGVLRTLLSMEPLTARQAARVAAPMNLAANEEFAAVVDEMGSPDGEG